MEKKSTKLKEKPKNKAQLGNSVKILATVAIIGFAITLLFLGQEAITNRMTGKIIRVEEGNLYGIIFIVLILFITSIATLIYLKKNPKY